MTSRNSDINDERRFPLSKSTTNSESASMKISPTRGAHLMTLIVFCAVFVVWHGSAGSVAADVGPLQAATPLEPQPTAAAGVIPPPFEIAPIPVGTAAVSSATCKRTPHAKPSSTQYWSGLYRDRVAFKLVDGLVVELNAPAPNAKPQIRVTSVDAARFNSSQISAARVVAEITQLNQLLSGNNVLGVRPLFTDPRRLPQPGIPGVGPQLPASTIVPTGTVGPRLTPVATGGLVPPVLMSAPGVLTGVVSGGLPDQRWMTPREFRQAAERRSSCERAYLENYFWAYLRPGVKGETVADMLNALAVVEIAYLPPIPQPADDIPPTTPDFSELQGYLEPAPKGIDARFAWSLPGGRGRGTRFVDIEAGWNLGHEDLKPPFFAVGWSLNVGPFNVESENHGTAVLGILVAQDNGYGVTGIVHEAEYQVASTIRPVIGNFITHDSVVADAIYAAGNLLSPGDVIVIEQHSSGPPTNQLNACAGAQFEYVPMEFFPGTFDIIQAATSIGFIVIEAAGNGSMNLDSQVYGDLFKRSFRDSGAIMVGASIAGTQTPACFTNFGSRVDVHAWGEGVMTTGYGVEGFRINGDDRRQWYTPDFGGTSSATPIVAGAVLSIQGMQKANNRPPLLPSEMRALLVETGTPQTTPISKHIGPMPNLGAFVEKADLLTTFVAGGMGGTAFSLQCDDGQMLVGAKGRKGSYIDQVIAKCANGAGVTNETPARGGTGGTPFDVSCPRGQGVTGFSGAAGFWVDSFRLECQSINSSNLPTGNRSTTPTVGGTGGQGFGPFRCPDGTVAVGLQGRAGPWIDALQLICARINLDRTPASGWVSAPVGGTGGESFAVSCNDDEVLVGVNAKAGFWLDSIAARCVKVGQNGRWIGDPRGTGSFGGGGGASVNRTCARDQAVVGISGKAGQFVDRLVLHCRRLTSPTVTQGEVSTLSPVGGEGGELFEKLCPSDLPVTGLQGKSGSLVDRLQIVCGRPSG